MTMNDIPSWLREEREYVPPGGRSRFAHRSARALLSAVSRFRITADGSSRGRNSAIRIVGLLIMLALTAAAHNFAFVIFMAAITLLSVAAMSGRQIRTLLGVLVPAVMLSVLILLPAIFLGNPRTPAVIIGRMMVCVSLVMTFSITTPFADITGALKRFLVPDVVIFTLDLALKYIFILSNISTDMLLALRVRSIGSDGAQSATAGGIMGAVLIKARHAADDTARAMSCRGFSGRYAKSAPSAVSIGDVLYVFLVTAVVAVFVYLEVMV